MAGEARLRDRRPAQEAHMRPSARRKGAAAGSPPGRGPPAQIEKAPPMSGTPYPPTDFLRSTFGEEGLNFRVRNGIG